VASAVWFSGCLADDAGRVAVRSADDIARGSDDMGRLPKTGFDDVPGAAVEPVERSPADALYRMVQGPEREWVCRTIDLGIAVDDGELSFDEFAAAAAQEAAGFAPQWRHRQAQAAVEQLLAGNPDALRQLACL
jgi:hypothetical protein